MTKRGEGPDFVEALARGLDVIACFDRDTPELNLAEVASRTGLARPTARRLLLTLKELGMVRSRGGLFALTPRVLTLGMAYTNSLGLWEVAEPHVRTLVAATGESSSIAQLDDADVVYIGRVAVPKLISLRVDIGTRFPALRTSQGKVLLAALEPSQVAAVLAVPSRSEVPDSPPRELDDVEKELRIVRARGWAMADEELAPGIRSIGAPLRDGYGTVRAALNVTVHASETSTETLLENHLPRLLRAASDISADWALVQSRPFVEVSGRTEVVSPG